MTRKLLLLFFVFVSHVMAAQHVPLRIMSQMPVQGIEDARCLMFDHYGLMWIGTDQGLRSFDGYHFKSYRSNAYSPGILPNNYVRCMSEDKSGSLWIGTRDGLVRYDRKHGHFKTYHLSSDQARSVNVLFTSADGTVWVGTDTGFSRFDAKKDVFVNINIPAGVHSFAEDARGNLYIGTWEGGLFRMDKKSGKMVNYPRLCERNTASSLLVDSRGRLWVGTWENGIVCLEHPENEHAPEAHHINEGRRDFRTFHQLLEDPVSHSVWGCCIEGLTRVGLDNLTEVENFSDLNFCYDMQTDGKGNLWVITRNQGIVHLSTMPSAFRFCYLNPTGRELPVNRIQTVFTSDGRWFWLGLQPYGLAHYDRVGNQVTYNSQIPGFSGMTDNAGIHAQTIFSVLDRGGGELWFGSSRGIISWKEGQQAQLLDYRNTPYLRDTDVKDFFRQRDGTVWIAQNNGISIVFPDGKGRMLKMSEAGRDFSNCDVQTIREDHQHRLWIATENAGILRVSGDARQPQSLRFHQYAPANNNYPLDDALACYEDAEHRLWAIASSGGLFLYDAGKDAFEPVNHRFHINVNSIYSIDGDTKGGLWLSTDKGLLRLKGDNNNKSMTYYGAEDGLDMPHFSPNGSFRYSKELFYGNVSGFFSFEPSQIEKYHQEGSAPLIVSDLLIDDVPYDWLDSTFQKKISACQPFFTKEITIPSSVDKFSVGFSLLTYQSQHQCRYAYRLENYDREWHYTDADNRMATYQNLPAGTYYLKLKAIDSYGHQTEMPYSIKVRVLPPWYLTWWAYLIYAALLAGAIYGGICWYKNYLKTKNRLAMAVVFTNITHELLTPLTIISASIDELRQKAPQFSANYGLVQHNIQRLTRLLRQILEVRKSQAGQLKLLVARGDLSQFVAKECESIRPMAGSKNEELIVACPTEGIDAWFDKDKIDKILYNLLSNAVKYNKEGGRITVTLTADKRQATLQVSDEGIGISKDKMKHLYTRFLDGDYRRMNTHGTGIGLSLTRNLVVLHHGKIDCQSREGEGTTFTVTFPITRTAYSEDEIDLTADNWAIDAQQTDQMEEQLLLADNEPESEDNAVEKDYSMLIVEDNHELLELMRKLFVQRYHVYTARNGKQALNTIYKRDLDIVITDVMMPIMDGIELTHKIKDSDDYAQLPVVMLTAKTTDEDKNVGYETGADAYITKPFRMGDLQLRIDNIIRNRERIRKKFSSQTDFKVEEQHYSSPDEVFIQKAIDCVKQHLDDADYDRERFASDMCVSSSTLYNKLRALTGQSVTGFINSIRLKEACRIMRQQPGIKMTELSMEVGFNTPKYFTKLFKKEFGMLPSEYINDSKG